jgi:hypothetical protein
MAKTSTLPGKVVITRRAPVGGITHSTTNKVYAGGQFIPSALQREQMGLAKDALSGLIDSAANSLQYLTDVYLMSNEVLQQDGLAAKLKFFVPLSSTEYQIQKQIREAYERSFELGKRAAGNLFAITKEEQKAIKKTRYDEYDYLHKFLTDMRNGTGKMDYSQRMDYYAKAVRELYWLGWASANRSAGRSIQWILGDTVHCATCEGAAGKGKMTADTFWKDYASKGILPQSGKLDCLGYHCKCALEEV